MKFKGTEGNPYAGMIMATFSDESSNVVRMLSEEDVARGLYSRKFPIASGIPQNELHQAEEALESMREFVDAMDQPWDPAHVRLWDFG